jgi:molybdate transport system regulatory protein
MTTDGVNSKMGEMDCLVKMHLIVPEHRTKITFNDNTAKLLQGVRECGSLNVAAKNLRMAYSHAWTMLNEVENYLDVKLIDRTVAKGSKLTEEGERLLDLYCTAREKAQQAAQATFDEFMQL